MSVGPLMEARHCSLSGGAGRVFTAPLSFIIAPEFI
jgi:hypothetical protein